MTINNDEKLPDGPSPCSEAPSFKEWLMQQGYDGLYVPGTCACELSDLAPCGLGPGFECKPGYKHLDPRPDHKKFGDWAIFGQKEEPELDDWDQIVY